MSQRQRLRRHAGKYHRLAHKSTVISKYSAKADDFGKADLRKHAAHVAAWIAYGPKGRTPETDVLKLLRKFMGQLGGGPLPARLREVLPDVQEALRSVPQPSARVDEGWTRAAHELRRSLQKFRCCRGPVEKTCTARVSKEGARDTVVVSDMSDMSDNDLADAQHDHAFDATDARDAGDGNAIIQVEADAAPPAHDQHLQLFSKINEWGFLDEAQRLERLEQVEAMAKRPRRSLDQAELAEAINVVVAALSPPRRQRLQQEAEAEGVDSECAEVPDCQKNSQLVGLQRRLRSLLLEALRAWRLRRFDCQAIEHVLEHVQGKISKFEDNVGEIQGAAAGEVWVSIKQTVDELLQRAEAGPSMPEAQRTNSAAHRSKNAGALKGRLERQSGIQGIHWSNAKSAWTVSRQEAGKQRQINFSIAEFLKQGLGEEEAVEATLQKAKAYREELVRQGKMQPSKPSTGKASQSLVRGVSFDERNNSWRVRLLDPATGKFLNGGSFKNQDESEGKAREMAQTMGLPAERSVVPVQKLSELPRFAPLGSQKGIIWRVGEQCWYADGRFHGVRRTMRFRPKDGSEAAVKKAWTEAVAWYGEQDDEKSQSAAKNPKP